MPERFQKRLSDDDAGPSQRPADVPVPSSELRAAWGCRCVRHPPAGRRSPQSKTGLPLGRSRSDPVESPMRPCMIGGGRGWGRE